MGVPSPVPEKLKSCGFLIVRGDPVASFLLMVHSGRLDLPKGHVEPGESELECALRELEEETSLAAADIEIDQEFRFTTHYEVRYKKFGRQSIPKTTVIFLARLLHEADIVVTEHVGFEWREWHPPHSIQAETIDPLLVAVAEYLAEKSS